MRIALFLALAASSAATARAQAFDCHEDVSAIAPEEPTAARDSLILPCAVADLGASCANASFYVLSTAGTMLCEMDIPLLAASGAPLSTVEREATAPSAPSVSTLALGLPASGQRVAPPYVIELSAARILDVESARDGFARPPTSPS